MDAITVFHSAGNGNKKTAKVNVFTGIYMYDILTICWVSPQQRIPFTISMSMLNMGQMVMLGKLETNTTDVIMEIRRLSHSRNQWSTTSQVGSIAVSFAIRSTNLVSSSNDQQSEGMFTCHVLCFYVIQRVTNFRPSHYTRRHSNCIWETSTWSWAD